MPEKETPATKQIFWSTVMVTLLSTWPFVFLIPLPFLWIILQIIFDDGWGEFTGTLLPIFFIPFILSIFTAYLFSWFVLSRIIGSDFLKSFRYWTLLIAYILFHYFVSVCLILLSQKLGLIDLSL